MISARTARRTIVLSAVLLGTALPPPAAADAPPGAWAPSTVPALQNPAVLHAVTAPGRQAAWTVGTEADGTAPVILRWRDGAWRREPAPAGTAPQLVDVDAAGRSNAWAVGQSGDATAARSLHWNGRGWKAVPHPVTTPMAVSVDSAGTAWSVGGNGDQNSSGVFRYRGGAWERQNLELPETMVTSVAARTPRDVWVGGIGSYSTPLHHFDGETWTKVSFPSRFDHWILEILPVAANDVWLYTMPDDPMFSGTRLVHWDGTTWTEHTIPRDAAPAVRASAQDAGFLGNIASDGRGGVWVQNNLDASYRHFDGTTWTSSPRPATPGLFPQNYAMTRIGDTRSVWAVGHAGGAPLIDRFR